MEPDSQTHNGIEDENGSSSMSGSNQNESKCECKPILVADDNEFNLFTLQQVLLSYGLEADGAFNGKVAAEMVNTQLETCCPYKIIFMDQNMPVMDGLQSTRAIKKIFKAYMEKEENQSKWDVRKTPIIALTANDTNQEK